VFAKAPLASLNKFMKFNYRARTKEGKMEAGTIEAYSQEAAAILLQKYNIFPTYLAVQEQKSSFLKRATFSPPVSKKDLAIFFKQLSIMLDSRVPVVSSLASLAAQTNKKSFKEIIKDIAGLVEEGAPLSGAFGAYPRLFGPFYINLVKSGEASGNISASLNYISLHLEREHDILVQLRQAMLYPVFVFCVLLVVIAIIIIEVMPRIASLVEESGTAPSAFISATLGFYAFLGNWWWVLLVLVLAVAGLIIFYVNTQEGKSATSRMLLKIPFLGGVLKKVFIARFCSNISTLIVAGVSIQSALKITEDTVSNPVYRQIASQIGKEISEGEKISYVMVKYKDYFPPFVVQMVKVGEETGKLDQTLSQVADFYQKDIKGAIDLFSSLLEPVMIIGLGIVVAAMAISVLGPLYGALGTI